jgi:hypothetical protein
MRGDGQTADRRLDARRSRLRLVAYRGSIRLVLYRLRRRHIQAKTLRIVFGDIQIAECRADRVALRRHNQPFGDLSAARRHHAHGRFVCLHFEHVLIGFHHRADGRSDIHDGRLGDGFAELWHDDRDERHGEKG